MTTESASDVGIRGADLRADGMQALREAMPGVIPDGAISMLDGKLGEELVELGLVSVWGQLWARPGLGKRERSLVTLSLLTALGAESELKVHVRVALTNGVTREEIAEILYHSAGYLGFPLAVQARTAMREALGEV